MSDHFLAEITSELTEVDWDDEASIMAAAGRLRLVEEERNILLEERENARRLIRAQYEYTIHLLREREQLRAKVRAHEIVADAKTARSGLF